MKRPIKPILFARPSLGRAEERAVLRVMRSGWLTTGEVAARFEQDFARLVGARYALAVSSATGGLHLSLEALGVGRGSRVITSPYTYASTAEAIINLGADPLFVDIEAETFNISPAAVEAALSRHGGEVSALLPVHVAGLPCRINEINALAERYRLPVVEDAAHAFPVQLGGRMVGTLGDAGVYSFYATKSITTGEGGMIVTGSEPLARRMTMMRLHGIDKDAYKRRGSGEGSWFYQLEEAGYKYNMTDICAAIGVEQLKKAARFLKRRQTIARAYLQGLAGLDFLILPPTGSSDRDIPGGGGCTPEALRSDHAWHLFIVRLNPQTLTVDRDRFVAELQAAGIGVSVHFIPLHTMPYYRRSRGYAPEDFPVSLRNYRVSFSLPIYPSLSGAQVDRVIETVRDLGRRFHR
jgi:dTDP-4-amino-4,6-dideoxygalactose transaminase